MKKALLLIATLAQLSTAGCAQPQEPPLKDKIAQMILLGFRGTELREGSDVYRAVRDLHVGGVILFDYDAPSRTRRRNIQSPEQARKLVAGLQQLSSTTLIVAIDEEGGKVSRLKPAYGFPHTVTARYQGATDKADTTRFYAARTAQTLADMGINLNFVPCVDVDVNPNCPVIGKVERSFSANPATVVKHARIWIEEHAKRNILTCPKHFPGHGSSTTDTHAGGADVTATWREAELLPYRELLATGSVNMVMTSHVFNANLDADYPATMSKKILTGILREQLGFRGVIVSDDLAMGAIADNYPLTEALEKAILAGVDILCLSNNGTTYDSGIAQKAIDTIYQLVTEGRIPEARINESYQRIIALKLMINKQ